MDIITDINLFATVEMILKPVILISFTAFKGECQILFGDFFFAKKENKN